MASAVGNPDCALQLALLVGSGTAVLYIIYTYCRVYVWTLLFDNYNIILIYILIIIARVRAFVVLQLAWF